MESPNRATSAGNGPQECIKRCKTWSRTPRKRETGPVGRSSKNRNFVTKNSTKILKIERGVLKIETPIFERLGPPASTIGGPHRVPSPQPKNFFSGGSTDGCWCKCNAKGPHGCVGHAPKWSRIRLEPPQVPPVRRYEKSNFC